MKDPLHLQYLDNEILIQDEPTYSLQSADNVRAYDVEYLLGDKRLVTSQHGITLFQRDGTLHSGIVLASGGCSTVHDRSALIVEGMLYIAVGDQICALALPTLSLLWNIQVDSATCFGVLYSATHHCLISHGELDIARVELDGTVTWHQSGGDIFTGELALDSEQVKVTDWNNDLYVFSIDNGRPLVAPLP